MVSELADICCHLGIIQQNHAAVTERTEVFARIKTETTCVSETSGLFPIYFSPKRLGTVLDHLQAIFFCQRANAVHISRMAEYMHRHDRPGPVRNLFLDL